MTRFASLIRDALRPGAHHEPEVHFHAVGGRPTSAMTPAARARS